MTENDILPVTGMAIAAEWSTIPDGTTIATATSTTDRVDLAMARETYSRRQNYFIGLLCLASLLLIFPALAAAQASNMKPQKPAAARYVGVASWYGIQHQGRKMANGQRFDRHHMTAACWYFPLGTIVRVFNLQNGRSELVTITDRGPDLSLDRVIDLSEAAADALGYVREGLTSVFVFPVTFVQPERAEIASNLVEPAFSEVSMRLEEPTYH